MEKSQFGRTDLNVSKLTFGCGAVGGLMTKGTASDQDNAVAWARDNGINFFDTAPLYGNGASEKNLGRALGGNADGLVIGTKVIISERNSVDIAKEVTDSIEASLTRLKLDHVDLLQLHNRVGLSDSKGLIYADQILSEVIPAFENIRRSGKVRYLGFTADGDPDQLNQLIDSGAFDSAQVFYNLLVPSAGEKPPAGYPAKDFQCLLDSAKRQGVGSIGVRVLAGGALSGSEKRNPLGMPVVAPIGSDTDYATDVQRALRFQSLIDEGVAASLPELAIRYAISNENLPTTEIGIASIEEVQKAAAAVNKGPLSADTLDTIRQIQAGLCDKATSE